LPVSCTLEPISVNGKTTSGLISFLPPPPQLPPTSKAECKAPFASLFEKIIPNVKGRYGSCCRA
jgi:hypothetical protein